MVSQILNQNPRMISFAAIFTKRDFAIYSGRDGSKVGGMKTNLEQLKEVVAALSQKHIEKLPVDDVMKINGPKGGFAILASNVSAFKSEMLALR
jgi:hypothetical protein